MSYADDFSTPESMATRHLTVVNAGELDGLVTTAGRSTQTLDCGTYSDYHARQIQYAYELGVKHGENKTKPV
jgi:hypothetical protein